MNPVPAILFPALVAALPLALSWRIHDRSPGARRNTWGPPVAFGAALFVCYVVLESWPSVPPAKAVQWLAWGGLLLSCGLAWESRIAERRIVRYTVWLVVGALLAWLQLRNFVRNSWTPAESAAWIGGFAVAASLAAHTLDTIAERHPGASVPLALWVLLAGTAGALVLGGSALLGQWSGGLAAAAGAAIVVSWLAPGARMSSGGATAIAFLWASLLLQGYHYAELPASGVIVLALAPHALRFTEQRRFVYQRPWRAALIRAVAVGVPVAAALLLCWGEMHSGDAGGYDEYYDY